MLWHRSCSVISFTADLVEIGTFSLGLGWSRSKQAESCLSADGALSAAAPHGACAPEHPITEPLWFCPSTQMVKLLWTSSSFWLNIPLAFLRLSKYAGLFSNFSSFRVNNNFWNQICLKYFFPLLFSINWLISAFCPRGQLRWIDVITEEETMRNEIVIRWIRNMLVGKGSQWWKEDGDLCTWGRQGNEFMSAVISPGFSPSQA